MATGFPFVIVPKEVAPIVGEPDEGTHVYRRFGQDDDYRTWVEWVFKVTDGAVSPGGAAAYVGVSREAVHKRLKEGRLTCFLFHLDDGVKWTVTGRRRFLRGPYMYIPVSECKAWQADLEGRRDKAEADRERRGDKAGSDDRFLREPEMKPRAMSLGGGLKRKPIGKDGDNGRRDGE